PIDGYRESFNRQAFFANVRPGTKISITAEKAQLDKPNRPPLDPVDTVFVHGLKDDRMAYCSLEGRKEWEEKNRFYGLVMAIVLSVAALGLTIMYARAAPETSGSARPLEGMNGPPAEPDGVLPSGLFHSPRGDERNTIEGFYFYGLQPRWMGWDRLFKIYVLGGSIAGAYLAGQGYDGASGRLRLVGPAGIAAPLLALWVRRIVRRRVERETRYGSLTPASAEFLDADSRNFVWQSDEIERATVSRKRSLWTAGVPNSG